MPTSSILPLDRTLSGAITLGQSGPGSNGNEVVLGIPQSSSIMRASPSDCLVLYLGRLLEGGLTPLQRCRRCILHPQLTGLHRFSVKINLQILKPNKTIGCQCFYEVFHKGMEGKPFMDLLVAYSLLLLYLPSTRDVAIKINLFSQRLIHLLIWLTLTISSTCRWLQYKHFSNLDSTSAGYTL